jgi:hypothetical protein
MEKSQVKKWVKDKKRTKEKSTNLKHKQKSERVQQAEQQDNTHRTLSKARRKDDKDAVTQKMDLCRLT